jgi:hypothetical protein
MDMTGFDVTSSAWKVSTGVDGIIASAGVDTTIVLSSVAMTTALTRVST